MDINPTLSSGNDEMCAQCGKSVPTLNNALHLLHCRKKERSTEQEQKKEQEYQQHQQHQQYSLYDDNDTGTIDISDTDVGEIGIQFDSAARLLGVGHSNDRSADESQTTEQWKCTYCTFLNNFEYIQYNEGDEIPLHYCSMCHNESEVFHDSFWRDSDTSTGRRDDDRFNDDSEEDNIPALSTTETVPQPNREDDSTQDSDEDESLATDLSTWTCSYCSIVNLTCEHSCQMCDMPDTNSSQGDQRLVTTLSQRSSLQQTMESTVPALCYLGLTVGALLTDSTRGSSARMRNGVIGSLVGTMAGVAIGALMSPWEEEEVLPPRGGSENSAAARLPVHRYSDTKTCMESKGAGSSDEQLKHDDDRDVDDDKVSCRICMEEYKHNEELKTLKCFHMFHAECIDRWLLRKTSCPLCCIAI